jgi:hypothetical protein
MRAQPPPSFLPHTAEERTPSCQASNCRKIRTILPVYGRLTESPLHTSLVKGGRIDRSPRQFAHIEIPVGLSYRSDTQLL